MKKMMVGFWVLLAFNSLTAEMGRFDPASHNWIVNTDFWQCIFLEGNMFPGQFQLRNGKTIGGIVFQDTAMEQNQKTQYRLLQERWAETSVISNTEDTFIIELSGGFWCNQKKIIPLKGVGVTCRYEFKRNSPSFRMLFRYRKPKGKTVFIYCSACPGWLYEQPFINIIANQKTEKFIIVNQKDRWTTRFWDMKQKLSLEAPDFIITAEAPRIIAGLRPAFRYPAFLNLGLWRYTWKADSTDLDFQAVLTITARQGNDQTSPKGS